MASDTLNCMMINVLLRNKRTGEGYQTYYLAVPQSIIVDSHSKLKDVLETKKIYIYAISTVLVSVSKNVTKLSDFSANFKEG